MPDWSSLKRRAQQMHRELQERSHGGVPALIPASELLESAAKSTNLDCYPVPPHDPLLSEAHAVLDRAKEVIWVSAELPVPRRNLIIAHEFAHYWLHPELAGDVCSETDAPEEFVPPSQSSHAAQIAAGYSPAERRETEANLFALELLLPAPLLRHAFVTEGRSAAEISQIVGVSESCVLSQLSQAVLLPVQRVSGVGCRVSETEISSEGAAGRLPDSFEGSINAGNPVSDTRHPTPDTLDSSQKIAAQIETGPVLVDAGPGTGKTRTLVARLCHLIGERGVPADNILALTFSNKAAEEMRTRLREAIGDTADRVWIGTFHAFGLELLRKDGARIKLPHAPQLLETADAILLLQEVIDILPLQHYLYTSQPALAFPDILRCISRAKDELKTPADYFAAAEQQSGEVGEKAREVARIYAVYEELLAERGLLDFGDLLMRPVQLLDSCPDVLTRWQEQFPHIVADEYQDINRASAELLKRLVGDGRGFWAVGDLRQAIYRFRGASPANVREFERDFPGGRRLRLEVNYRTRESIVGLFAASAARMPDTQDAQAPQWQAHRADTHEPAVTLAIADDEAAQADGIAAEIRKWEAAGVRLPQQAILCRTNRQAGDLAGLLEQRGVPVQHLGSLFERSEIKDLLALLALTCEPHGASLLRVAHFPAYAVPPDDVKLLLEAAQAAGKYFPAALSLADDLPGLSERGRAGLRRLWRDVQPIAFRGDAWFRLSRYLFAGSDYLRPLLASGAFPDQQKCLAIQRLLAFAQNVGQKFKDTDEIDKTKAFLAYLRHLLSCGEERSVRVTDGAENLPAVRLITAHSSKGLEFPVVYLPNLIKGQFPTRRQGSMASPPPFLQADGQPAEMEEDTDDSLFFVALSRARDHLVLSYPMQRGGRKTELSPYLDSLLVTLKSTHTNRVAWHTLSPQTETGNETPSGIVTGERQTFSLTAIEQYQDCPRQFYYQRVLHLRTGESDSPTRLFHTALQETMRWLDAERETGNAPTPETVQQKFSETWQQNAPEEESGLHRILHSQGAALAASAGANLPLAAQPAVQKELTAELANGNVRLQCDRASVDADGTLHIERHIKRELRPDDHLAPRLALLRRAAKQEDGSRPVAMELVSLATGETRSVPEKEKLEIARVEKYEIALTGIRAQHYPAVPDDRKCPQCPYYFVCPA